MAVVPSNYAHPLSIDLDEVVNLFATKHPQRLELGTILKDSNSPAVF